MSEQLVAGPQADPPNVNGFWADRNFNWNNTTVAVRMPTVAVANQPVRVWVCLALGVGDHQGGAGIAYSNLRLLQGGQVSSGVDTGSVSSPLDDEYPNGSTRNPGAEPCLAVDMVAPNAGTNVGGTVPQVALRVFTVCVACSGGFGDVVGGTVDGSPVNLGFNFPKVIPDSAENDYVMVAGSGATTINPLPNDYDPLHANNGSTSLFITGVTSVDGNATCTLNPDGVTVSITPIGGATSGVCNYVYSSNEISSYDLTRSLGNADIVWNTLPEPQPLAGADYGTVDAWYGALNSPASTGADVDIVLDLLANDSDPQGGDLAVSVVPATTTQGGSITDNGDGTVTYTPAEGFCGEDSFQYTMEATDPDPAAAPVITTRTAQGVATIEVICNNAPIAIDDTYFASQGGSVSASVRANDLDFEDPNAGMTYTLVTGPANGTLTLNADGSFTYTHDGSVSPVTDTFTYEVCDNHATLQPPSDPATLPRCAQATATVNVSLAPQAAPVAVADAGEVEAWYSGDGHTQTSIVIDAAGNDSDANGNLDPTSVTVSTGPTAAQGVLTNNGDGTLTFEPADGYAGPVTVVYEICDDPAAATPVATASLCNSAVILITVHGNSAPIAINDADTVAQDSAGTAIDVTANDFDPSSDGVVVTAVDATSANGGTVVNNADGTVTYTPAPGFFGTDTFEYTLCDDHSAAVDSTAVMAGDPWVRCTTGTVTVTVTETPNNPPFALLDNAATPEDTPVTIDLLANDFDFEDDAAGIPLTMTSVDATSLMGGTVIDNGDGTATYTPAPGFCGLDSFGYTIEDSAGLPGAAIALIVVTCDSAPNAEDDSANTPQDTPVNITWGDNDADPEDGAPVLDSVNATSVEGGTVVDNGDGTFGYTPPAGFCGLDTFDYAVVDSNGQTDSATVSVNVVCDESPSAEDDSANTPFDTPVTIDYGGNDTDPEDGAPTLDSVDATSAEGGTVVDNGDGTFGYTPASGFCGVDTFDYIVADSAGNTDVATVSVNVLCDQVPNAEDDSVNTAFNTAATISYGGNDTDPEDGTPTLDSVDATSTEGATVVDNGDGTFGYTPAADFCGVDTFNYTVVDTAGNTDTATVTVEVACADQDSDVDGIPDWVEIIICGTATCADGTEDTDGNGIPDWTEIIICGAPGCVQVGEGAGDEDGDGIPDWVEIIVCGTTTCATGAEDSDGDGIPDWVEVLQCGSVTCATTEDDSDGDGIPDWIEIIICGSASCADGSEDADGDGVPDWIEIIMCGSVDCANAESDSDGDGVPDWIEVNLCGTSTCLDPATDSDGDGIPDWVEVLICGTATCADGTEDTDGNGIPDWQEIATCGEPGCLLDSLRTKPVGACSNTATFTIPGTLEYDIPNGFRSNTDIRIYMFSDPKLLYSGVLPDSGKVSLSIPGDIAAGKHKFMVIGVDDITGAVKIDGCSRNGELPKASVAGATQSPAAAKAATTTAAANTGASLVKTGLGSAPALVGAAVAIGLGLALVLMGRKRRDRSQV